MSERTASGGTPVKPEISGRNEGTEMKEIRSISTRKIKDEKEQKITLYYDLVGEEREGRSLYGVRIVKEFENSLGVFSLESRTTPVFLTRREEALEFLNRLARGTVTPVGLYEAADDFEYMREEAGKR